jgi:hypothetical protein
MGTVRGGLTPSAVMLYKESLVYRQRESAGIGRPTVRASKRIFKTEDDGRDRKELHLRSRIFLAM